MKKLTTLLLALFLLIAVATLSSCDIVNQYIPNFNGDTDNGTGNSRITVTKKEWLDIMSITNYTKDVVYLEPNENGYNDKTATFAFQYTESAESHFKDWYTHNQLFYYAEIDGVTYKIESTEDGYIAEKTDYEITSTPIGSYMYCDDLEAVYDDIVFDSLRKKYTYENEHGIYDITFEDGKLSRLIITGETEVIIISNAGTTTFELPEFTYEDDTEEVRTTITEEEWAEFFELNNFSYTVNAGDVQMTIKMTESAYHVQQGEYYEIIVLIDGVLYSLHPYEEDRYFASEYTGSSPLSNIGNMLHVSYNALVYDAETKSYTAQGKSETYVFYFENGKIVAGEIVFSAPDGSETKGILYDFGTTVLNFPNVLLPNQ